MWKSPPLSHGRKPTGARDCHGQPTDASRRTADGYRIQAAIPWCKIGVSLDKSRRLGFDLIIYDGYKPDAAPGENINKSRLAWAPVPA